MFELGSCHSRIVVIKAEIGQVHTCFMQPACISGSVKGAGDKSARSQRTLSTVNPEQSWLSFGLRERGLSLELTTESCRVVSRDHKGHLTLGRQADMHPSGVEWGLQDVAGPQAVSLSYRGDSLLCPEHITGVWGRNSWSTEHPCLLLTVVVAQTTEKVSVTHQYKM